MAAARLLGILAVAAMGLVAVLLVSSRIMNARAIRELREHPNGERARRVMILSLPSGKTIPVNYLREGRWVYAGADFPWWRELAGDGGEVRALIRGRSLAGRGRAILDDPERRAAIFGRLRPDSPSWAGTLIAIELRGVEVLD